MNANIALHLNIYKKNICLFLSLAFTAVQLGCHTTGIIKSVDPQETPVRQDHRELFKNDLLIKILYKEGDSYIQLTGKIKVTTSDKIIVITPENKDVSISWEQIKKIYIYGERLDVVSSVLAGTLIALVVYGGILIKIAMDSLGQVD